MAPTEHPTAIPAMVLVLRVVVFVVEDDVKGGVEGEGEEEDEATAEEEAKVELEAKLELELKAEV